MLRSIDEIRGYKLAAADGEFGRCKDFLFDDRDWVVRYLVADTGTWLPGRKVLVSPVFLGEPTWTTGLLPVSLTKEEIEAAPPLDEHAPVARQEEMKYFDTYGFPYYWVGAGLWGAYPTPVALGVAQRQGLIGETEPPLKPQDAHLRSVKEVTGYHLQATDEEIGHVDDFVLDDASWKLRYVVVDTRNWLPGKRVLVSPDWVETVDWSERKVRVALETDAIRNSPEFDPKTPINREYETRLYDFYGRPYYWR